MSSRPLAGRRILRRKALIDALSLPAFILLFTMMGFGSLAGAAGFDVSMAALATIFIWGLPGQLAMVELTSTGQSVIAAVVACSMANARFMPMVVSFLPSMARGRTRLGQSLLDAQLLSINSWAMGLRQFPDISLAWRRYYYRWFASIILSAAVLGTVLGYYGGLLLPAVAVLGLIFTSPLFFALVLAETRGTAERASLLFGCLLIAILHPLLPDFDLLLTGLIGGTAGFLVTHGRDLFKRKAG